MKKLYVIALVCLSIGVSNEAFAELANMTNNADGVNRDSGISAVKEKLNAACKERGGTPDSESFEVVFEKTSPNPDVPKPYYVDAKMKCDLP
jgi:hypothetical protein